MSRQKTQFTTEMDLEHCFKKMESTLRELKLPFKDKSTETKKKITLKVPYYFQKIEIEIQIRESGSNTTVILTGDSDDIYGTGIIKNLELIKSKFNDEDIEYKLYTVGNLNIESIKENLSSLYHKFLGLNLYIKIIIGSIFIVLVGNTFEIGKPSICDCSQISQDAILKNDNSGWYDCVKSYENEIREYGKSNGLNYVDVFDEGHLYFNQKCNK